MELPLSWNYVHGAGYDLVHKTKRCSPSFATNLSLRPTFWSSYCAGATFVEAKLSTNETKERLQAGVETSETVMKKILFLFLIPDKHV